MVLKDLTGQTFGRLTVEELIGTNKDGRSLWRCRCNCGNEKITNSNCLKMGKTKSCGCLAKEKRITHPNRTIHGSVGTRLYRIWKKMKSRCFNPNDPDYKKYYGARGISVCNEWRIDFSNFKIWAMANGYSDFLTLDRIDVNGNYEPANCRWATAKQQASNKRGGVFH